MKLSRLAGAGGVSGPVLFTLAWVAGFVLLGAGTVVPGTGLGRLAASRAAGPWLVLVAGAASVAAGLSRRDHMLLAGPGSAGESWHDQVHDVASGAAYGAMLAAPLVLARRWRDDPHWAPVSRPVLVLALASAAALAVFASQAAGPCNGVVQRIAVTLALAAEILIAGRMLTVPAAGSAAGPGVTRPGSAGQPGRLRQCHRFLPDGPAPARDAGPGPDRVHTCRNDY